MGRGWIAGAVVLVLASAAFLLLRQGEEGGRRIVSPDGTVTKGVAPAKSSAPEPAGTAAPVPVAGDGGAEGYLLRSLTGAPIPGTAVATTRAGAVVTAAAGADGIFRLRGLPRGEVVAIEFTSPGLLRHRMPRASIPVEGTLDLGYVVLGEAQRLDILVVDGTGAPIEGCALAVVAAEWRPAAEAAAAPEVPEAEAATDAAGRAAFPDLPPGPWLVRAFAAGRARAALSVDLVEGAIREPLRIILEPGFPLEGRVLHADGRPAARALVVAGPGDRAAWFYPPTSAAADAEGRFRIEGLEAGTTSLSVVAFPGVSETVPDVGIPAPGPVEIRLAPRAEIAGRVVDDGSGAPLEGAEVAVRLSAGQGMGRIAEARRTTGADGSFRFPDLPAYPVESVGASKPGYYEARSAPAPAEGKERELRLRKGAAVRGVVRDRSGAPVSLAWVRLSTWRGRDGVSYLPDVRSDEAGRYEIAGVPPGPGLLEAGGRKRHLPGVPEDTWQALRNGDVPESCGVTVPEGGVVEKDLVLVPDSRVEGRILHGDGTPAPGFVAHLSDADEPGAGTQGTASAADGSFVIEDLEPAVHRVVVAMGPSGRVGVSAPFDLVESEVTRGVTVTVAAPASLAGRVLREDGQPAAGASLHLVARRFDPDQPWQWMNLQGRRGDPDSSTTVVVAADGTFRAEGLPPGPWTPVASAPDCLERRGETLDLADGEKREGVVILLAPGFAIAGRVLDPAGAPAAGVAVTSDRRRRPSDGPATPEERTALIYARMNDDARAGFTTDAEGRFRIERLAPGTYEVRAVREGSVAAAATAEAGGPEVVLQLGEGFPIQGRAVEQGTQKPAAGVLVSATGVPARSVPAGDFEEITVVRGGRFGRRDFGARTAADGTFEVKGLAAGAWDLRFDSRDGTFAPKEVHGVAAGTKNLVVEIPRGLTIAGRVEDAGGQPLDLRGLTVELSFADSRAGSFSREEEVEAGGVFSLGGLVAGRYRVTLGSRTWNDEKGVYPARTVEAEAGATDLVVSLARGRPITGRVVLADGTVPPDQDFEVSLHPSGGGEGPRAEEWVSVDEKGAFHTDPLPEGVPFDLEVKQEGEGMVGAAREILPGAAGVVLRLEKGRGIRGKVLDPEGNLLPGATVFARPARSGEVRAQAEAGPEGTFTLEGLAPGSYRLYARGEAGNFSPVEPEGLVAAGAEGAVVKTGKGFEFRARCVAADGKPVEGAGVFVEAFLDGRWEGPEYHEVFGDGVLVLRGLPRCRVRARAVHAEGLQEEGEMSGPFEVPGDEATLTLPK